MKIEDLNIGDEPRRQRCAELLVEAFREFAPTAWPTLADALEEVDDVLVAGPVRIAVEGGEIVGWIGANPQYHNNVWELHPVVVDPAHQRNGIGRALLADMEDVVADRGGLTLILGSDDQEGWTSLAGVDVFPDPLTHLAALEDRNGHPFGFYRKCGFALSGIVPDANGFGKPDIIMSKRVTR